MIHLPQWPCKVIVFSPWTGEPWARLGEAMPGEWNFWRAAAEGEVPWLELAVPGSLLLDHGWRFEDYLAATPRDLLVRELGLLQSAPLPCDNGATNSNGDHPMSTQMHRIAELRLRIQQGQQIPDEELREAIKLMRQDRVSAAVRSAASRAPKAAAVDPDAALADFLQS